jgi:SAM-dependent methyltransferase
VIKYLIAKVQVAMRIAIMSLGVDLYMRTDDRRVLEQVILPYFAERNEYMTVLFVGCDWYTRGYYRLFQGKNYWTIDINPRRKRYGAKLHIVDSLSNIDSHFHEGELDLIICNGVFGFGLNEKDEVEKAIRGCYTCLRRGGFFVLGWNDTPERRPFSLGTSTSLRQFNRRVFPPLSSDHLLTTSPNRHTYDFFTKPARSDIPATSTKA